MCVPPGCCSFFACFSQRLEEEQAFQKELLYQLHCPCSQSRKGVGVGSGHQAGTRSVWLPSCLLNFFGQRGHRHAKKTVSEESSNLALCLLVLLNASALCRSCKLSWCSHRGHLPVGFLLSHPPLTSCVSLIPNICPCTVASLPPADPWTEGK